LARKLLRHWHQSHYRLRNGDLQTLPADAPPPAGGTLLGRFEHTDYLDDTTPPPPRPAPSAAVVARVTALITNTLTPWEEADRPQLEGMSATQLDHLTPLVAPLAAGPPPPSPPPGAVIECYAPLNTLDLAVQQQQQLRERGYVSPVTAPPSNTTRFLLTRPRQKPGAVPLAPLDTFTETVVMQRRLGLRTDPELPPTLATNAGAPCACQQHGRTCLCPPDTLAATAASQKSRQDALERARLDDGEWRPLRVMMSA
jgi:hypothetical protein